MNKVKRLGTIGLSVALGVSLLGILIAVWNAPSTRANAAKTSLAPTRKLTNAAREAISPIQECIAPPAGMIGWWPGDGNADDVQDGNNGTPVGATFAPGKVDQAFSLDGVDDYINVPDADNLDISTQITIDAWINPTALGGRIVDKVTPGEPDGYLLDTFGGRVRFVFGGQELSGSTTLPTGTFTHVAATYDFETLRVYVNGVPDGTLTVEEIAAAPNNVPLRIGADQTGASTFSGLIDEVEIFDRPLSGGEILSIVNAGSAGKCKATCVLTCPENISQSNDLGQCGAVVSFAPASSACGTVTCAPPSGSFLPKGPTGVTCTSSAGPMCSFTVTINDTQPPTMNCPDITKSTDAGQCTAVAAYPDVATDNCPDVSVMCTPSSGSTFPLGPTTVDCSATDTSSNTAMCSFTVTVEDTQPPTLTPCPANITVITEGDCQAVTYTPPTATDNCGMATVSCTPSSGFCFLVGTTTVTCTASDDSPDSPDSTCTFTVTVTRCATTCPANIMVNNAPGRCDATVTFAATSPSICGTVSCNPASGSVFPVGTTPVICSATQGPSCMFNVKVNDAAPPTLTPCPANMSVPTEGVCQAVTYTPPTATDNCGSAAVSCTPSSGFCFLVGTTTVTCTASDNSPDSPDSTCTFMVTVTRCETTCPPNIMVNNAPGRCDATVTFAATAPPGCGTVSCNPASGSVFPVGTTTVICSAALGTSCMFNVKVNDVEPPTVTCSPIVATTGGACPLAAAAPVSFSVSASDQCSVASTVCKNQNDQVVTSGSPFPLGTTTVICTATDTSGNTANCSFSVTLFSGCVQDDSDPSKVVLFNAQTGLYQVCCGGTQFTGVGTVTIRGCLLTIQNYAPDHRVLISTDGNTGFASLQSPPGVIKCTIQDRSVRNNSCVCQ